jgi:small ligand-binding sensory domain FIST
MVRAGAGFSALLAGGAAGEEAARRSLASAGLPRAEAALLFATPRPAAELERLLDAASAVLGTTSLVGATAKGVFAGATDAEEGPASAVLALAGLEAQPFLLPSLRGSEPGAGAEIRARIGAPLGRRDLVVLLPDPTALALRPLLAGLPEALGPALLVGAGAATGAGGAALQWCGAEVASGGLAGVVLRGAGEPSVRISQACRPVTPVLGVTRSSGHWIESIDGRPALDVYRDAARGPLAADLRRAASFLMVALPAPGEASLARGRYRVRNVVGFAEERGAFAVSEPLGRGQEIAFALRDPEEARDDLRAMAEEVRGATPGAALYLSCCGRGRSLFGVPGLEAGYLAGPLGEAPLVGMQGPCQIAPLGGRPELLTYAGILALVS